MLEILAKYDVKRQKGIFATALLALNDLAHNDWGPPSVSRKGKRVCDMR